MEGCQYKSEYITIEELPSGCVITDRLRNQSVQVGALEDINAVIASLEKLKLCWYGEKE